MSLKSAIEVENWVLELEENVSVLSTAEQYAVTLAHECRRLREDLRTLATHYDDLGKSNPGFLGKLRLADYALFNKAMGVVDRALNPLPEQQQPTP